MASRKFAAGPARDIAMRHRGDEFREVWGQRIGAASFCNGAQNGSSFCRVVTADFDPDSAGRLRPAAKASGCPRGKVNLLEDKEAFSRQAERTSKLFADIKPLQEMADRQMAKAP